MQDGFRPVLVDSSMYRERYRCGYQRQEGRIDRHTMRSSLLAISSLLDRLSDIQSIYSVVLLTHEMQTLSVHINGPVSLHKYSSLISEEENLVQKRPG